MQGVRIVAKIDGITLALNYFQRWPYPEAVKRLNEKLQQYEEEHHQAEEERKS